ncbi:MAG: SAM-dependent methyltransferase, partial [Candidatus Binatia bacterium]
MARRPPPRRRRPAPPRPPRGWEPVAGWYDELVGERGSEYHREVVIPGTLRLVEPAPGMKVLDLASGQGVVARALAD